MAVPRNAVGVSHFLCLCGVDHLWLPGPRRAVASCDHPSGRRRLELNVAQTRMKVHHFDG